MGSELVLILPIILISLFAISAIVIDAIWLKNKIIGFIYSIIALSAVGIAAILNLINTPTVIIAANSSELITRGMLAFGGYTAFFDILFCLAAIMTILAAHPYLKREYGVFNEFYSLILFSVSGMLLIAHANNLLILFIGIEIMSISFYVLAGFFRTQILSIEASLKYFLLGAFATGFLLYGMALIYGSTGSIDIGIIAEKAKTLNSSVIFTMGVGLLIIGFCFKIAAFPFHQWAPDVYHGSPTVVSGFMSAAGKAAAFIGFLIIARALFPIVLGQNAEGTTIHTTSDTVRLIIAIISAGTMILGNISALVQKNVKRMLAYSSVAHAGYLLMGIVANSHYGREGIVFYATAYILMQIGAFTIVSVLERNNEGNLNISDYSGLRKAHPILAAMMAVFMFSLVGIPPFAGFFGKYYLFAAAIKAGFTWLTIVAVVASLISVYFYIGLILNMYFKDQPGSEPLEAKTSTAGITLAISTIGVILLGIFPQYLIEIAQKLF